MNYEETTDVIYTEEDQGLKIEILEYKKLKGARSVASATQLYFAQEAGLKLRMVRITLKNCGIKTEAGALFYHKGNIQCETPIGGVSGAIGKMFKGSLNKESTFKPVYRGQGEVYLEPTFGHYATLQLDNDTIIVDKGMFYCCSEGMNVDVQMQSNMSSALLGGEGLFQTKISGTGLIVLSIPVPIDELIQYELNGEKLQVDGNFAILRSGNVNFTVEKSSKSLFGSIASGEGLLQTFQGKGMVWMAPTSPTYNSLEFAGVFQSPSEKMNNKQ